MTEENGENEKLMMIYLQMIDIPEDKNKFEKVYLEYRGLMFWAAHEILHNTQDAEDAVHQAFVSIAKNMEKISEAVCPKTKSYVVTIVENKAIDMYRKSQRHPEIELNEEVNGLTVEYQGQNRLTDCLLRLPARYRNIILLRFYHGYDIREIAHMLGVSESNASKLLYRAKSRLEIICREEGIL